MVICKCYGPINNLTGFEAGCQFWSWSTGFKAGWYLNWFTDPLKNIKVSWHLGGEQEWWQMTVAITLHTAVLVFGKLSWLSSLLWSSLPEQVAPKTSAVLPWQRASENTELTEYVVYSSNSSFAWCLIKVSCLPSLLWSPSPEKKHTLHRCGLLLEIHISSPKIWIFCTSLLMFRLQA